MRTAEAMELDDGGGGDFIKPQQTSSAIESKQGEERKMVDDLTLDNSAAHKICKLIEDIVTILSYVYEDVYRFPIPDILISQSSLKG